MYFVSYPAVDGPRTLPTGIKYSWHQQEVHVVLTNYCDVNDFREGTCRGNRNEGDQWIGIIYTFSLCQIY
jgi:hypothetical protein